MLNIQNLLINTNESFRNHRLKGEMTVALNQFHFNDPFNFHTRQTFNNFFDFYDDKVVAFIFHK